jgi:hypothetical protein
METMNQQEIENFMNEIQNSKQINNKNCDNCKHVVKFPIFNMECHINNDEYNPLFEVCCNKFEMKPTNTNIAKYFHFTRQTIATYKKKNREHYEALKDRFIKMTKEEEQ